MTDTFSSSGQGETSPEITTDEPVVDAEHPRTFSFGRRSRPDKKESHISEVLSASKPQSNFLRESLTSPLSNYYMILISTTLLTALGLVMVLSSSSVFAAATGHTAYYYVIRQTIFLMAGIPLVWWLGRWSAKRMKFVATPAIILAMVLLITTLVIGSDQGKGNQNWIVLGPISVQPSELAKPAMILWAAMVWSANRKRLHELKTLMSPVVIVSGLLIGLVLFQRDLGTAAIMCMILFALLYFVGASWKVLAGLGAAGGLLVLVMVLISPNRVDRIFAFLGHESASVGSTDQPLSAIYALASGGWFGLGLGASRQKWGFLYDGAHNDFIFAVIGEEMGLLGTMMVVILFSILGYAGYRVALRATTLFDGVIAAGVTTWILFQAIVNICMAMRILPVIGIPLPFISYGGSALVSCLIGIALLISCARRHPDAQKQLLRNRQSRRARVSSIVDKGSSR